MPQLFSNLKNTFPTSRLTLIPTRFADLSRRVKSGLNAKKGFTLIEVVLVTGIVGLMALLITNLPSSINLNSNSNYQSLAKQIASKQLEDLRLQTYENLANSTQPIQDPRLSSLPKGNGTIVVDDCSVQICTQGEQLKTVTVTINWFEKTSTTSAVFTTMIGLGGLK